MMDENQAVAVLRLLIDEGYAGLDARDSDRFVIVAPEPFLSDGETAADDLGADFLRSRRGTVECILPRNVRSRLNVQSAPRIAT